MILESLQPPVAAAQTRAMSPIFARWRRCRTKAKDVTGWWHQMKHIGNMKGAVDVIKRLVEVNDDTPLVIAFIDNRVPVMCALSATVAWGCPTDGPFEDPRPYERLFQHLSEGGSEGDWAQIRLNGLSCAYTEYSQKPMAYASKYVNAFVRRRDVDTKTARYVIFQFAVLKIKRSDCWISRNGAQFCYAWIPTCREGRQTSVLVTFTRVRRASSSSSSSSRQPILLILTTALSLGLTSVW